MERLNTTENPDFFANTGEDRHQSTPPLSESLGSVRGDQLTEPPAGNGRMIDMLESVGVPRRTSENIMNAINSPRVKEKTRQVQDYVRSHPAQVLGTISAVAAGAAGILIARSRRASSIF